MISLSSIVKAKQLVNLPSMPADTVSPAPETGSFGADVGNSMDHSAAGREFDSAPADNLQEREAAILRQALKKAKHIETEAQLRADSILEGVTKTCRELMAEAEKKGYDEGYLRGLVDGANASEAAAEEGIMELRRLMDLFRTEERQALARNDRDLMEIAFELARKIMRQHVKVDDHAVQKMLEEIILENETSLKIYFSEYQKTLNIRIDQSIAKKLRALTKDAKLVLIKEEDLIMSETEGGIADMSVPVQLAQLKKAVDQGYDR